MCKLLPCIGCILILCIRNIEHLLSVRLSCSFVNHKIDYHSAFNHMQVLVVWFMAQTSLAPFCFLEITAFTSHVKCTFSLCLSVEWKLGVHSKSGIFSCHFNAKDLDCMCCLIYWNWMWFEWNAYGRLETWKPISWK